VSKASPLRDFRSGQEFALLTRPIHKFGLAPEKGPEGLISAQIGGLAPLSHRDVPGDNTV